MEFFRKAHKAQGRRLIRSTGPINVVLLSLRYEMFLNFSAINNLLVNPRTLCTSSLEEILSGLLLLLQCWRYGEQFRRSKEGGQD